MKRNVLLAGLLLAALPLCAQNKDAKKGDKSSPAPTPAKADSGSAELKDPVAIVDGQKISRSELEKAFDETVASAGVKPEDLSTSQKLDGYRQILNEMITEKLVSKEAAAVSVSKEDVEKEVSKIRSGFPSEKDFEEQLKRANQTPAQLSDLVRSMLQQRKWIESQLKGKDEVTEADAKKFYDENQKEFENPEMVKASHILFMVPEGAPEGTAKEKEAAAKAAIARLAKGEDFTALAKELSEEPGAKESGGDLGFFTKERMVPEFSTAAFAQKPGDYTKEPVKTQFGYHVIKTTEKKDPGVLSFSEIKDRLIAYLQNEKRREEVAKLLKEVRDNAKVEVFLPSPEKQQ